MGPEEKLPVAPVVGNLENIQLFNQQLQEQINRGIDRGS